MIAKKYISLILAIYNYFNTIMILSIGLYKNIYHHHLLLKMDIFLKFYKLSQQKNLSLFLAFLFNYSWVICVSCIVSKCFA